MSDTLVSSITKIFLGVAIIIAMWLMSKRYLIPFVLMLTTINKDDMW